MNVRHSWDTFLETYRPDIGFMQTSWWAEFLEESGWEHFGAVFREGNVVLGGARVLCRPFADDMCFYFIPDGPVLPENPDDAKQLFEALLSYVDQERANEELTVTHLRLEPRWASRPTFVSGCREAGSWIEPRRTLMIDLLPTDAEILAQMKPKGRYNIRLAARHGVTVMSDCASSAIAQFLDIYQETASRKPMSKKRPAYLASLCRWLFEREKGALYFALYQGKPVAAALVVFHGDRATYFFGGSLNEHREVMAPYMLHYQVMLDAKSRGHRWYDLFGTSPKDNPTHRWAQISTFKRKFGGLEMDFGPALDFIFEPDGYQAYRNRKSRR